MADFDRFFNETWELELPPLPIASKKRRDARQTESKPVLRSIELNYQHDWSRKFEYSPNNHCVGRNILRNGQPTLHIGSNIYRQMKAHLENREPFEGNLQFRSYATHGQAAADIRSGALFGMEEIISVNRTYDQMIINGTDPSKTALISQRVQNSHFKAVDGYDVIQELAKHPNNDNKQPSTEVFPNLLLNPTRNQGKNKTLYEINPLTGQPVINGETRFEYQPLAIHAERMQADNEGDKVPIKIQTAVLHHHFESEGTDSEIEGRPSFVGNVHGQGGYSHLLKKEYGGINYQDPRYAYGNSQYSSTLYHMQKPLAYHNGIAMPNGSYSNYNTSNYHTTDPKATESRKQFNFTEFNFDHFGKEQQLKSAEISKNTEGNKKTTIENEQEFIKRHVSRIRKHYNNYDGEYGKYGFVTADGELIHYSSKSYGNAPILPPLQATKPEIKPDPEPEVEKLKYQPPPPPIRHEIQYPAYQKPREFLDFVDSVGDLRYIEKPKPMIRKRSEIKPEMIFREESVPKPEKIYDAEVSRQKAREIAEKARRLINEAAKKLKLKKYDQPNYNFNHDIAQFDIILQKLNKCADIGDLSVLANVLQDLANHDFGDSIFADDFEKLMIMVPEMYRPYDQTRMSRTKYHTSSNEHENLLMHTLDLTNEFDAQVMPENYKRLVSQIVVPKRTVVRIRDGGKSQHAIEEEIVEEEDTRGFQFFKDFGILLDRQLHLDQELMSLLGNFHQDTKVRDIARYPLEDLLALIWNCFQHLRKIPGQLITPVFCDFIYQMFSIVVFIIGNELLTEEGFLLKIKEKLDILERPAFIYLKAFTGHLRRITGVCSEDIGGAAKLCRTLSNMFSTVIFRTMMPVTGDIFIPPSLQIKQINIWDSEEDLASKKATAENLKAEKKEESTPPEVPAAVKIEVEEATPAESSTVSAKITPSNQDPVLLGKRESLTTTPRISIVQFNLEDNNGVQHHSRARANSRGDKESRKSSAKKRPRGKSIIQKHEDLNLLHQLSILSKAEDETRLNELFEWDKVTFEDIEAEVLGIDFAMTPFGRVLEIIIKYWDSLYAEKK